MSAARPGATWGGVPDECLAVAAEPKVVFPDLGAVGRENTFLVGPGGLERITFSDEDLVMFR